MTDGRTGGRRTGGRRTGGNATLLQRMLSAIRAVAGMPDYAAYVAHLRRCHPDRPVPSERQFYDEFVTSRYGDGPTRCC